MKLEYVIMSDVSGMQANLSKCLEFGGQQRALSDAEQELSRVKRELAHVR